MKSQIFKCHMQKIKNNWQPKMQSQTATLTLPVTHKEMQAEHSSNQG